MQAVQRFVIGHKEFGEVQFLREVDICGLALDTLIDIGKGRIQLYGVPGGPSAPDPGIRLNVPAMLTFRFDLPLWSASCQLA